MTLPRGRDGDVPFGCKGFRLCRTVATCALSRFERKAENLFLSFVCLFILDFRLSISHFYLFIYTSFFLNDGSEFLRIVRREGEIDVVPRNEFCRERQEMLRANDRYVPTRALIDFDVAYHSFFDERPHVRDDHLCPGSPSYKKRMGLRKNLERLANMNQRLFKISQNRNEPRIERGTENRVWPCNPRERPQMEKERVLDLPEFNRGFHLSSTIDWGPQDVIATSVANRIVVGTGFSGDRIKTEVVTEYENDVGTAVSWSLDGTHLAAGTETGTVQVWDMARRKLLVEKKCCGDSDCIVTGLQWHPKQRSLAWACSAGKIFKRDFRDNVMTEVKNAHEGCICNLRYSPSATYLCSSGQDGFVRVWRGDNYEPYMEIEMSNPVRAIAWHPWRSGLLAVGEGQPPSGSLCICNVNTSKIQYMAKPRRPVAIKALEFSKISGELVCSQWVYEENEERCEIFVLGGPNHVVDLTTENSGCVTSFLWNPDGTKLGTAGSDETFKIWKFHKSRKSLSRKRHEKNRFLAFNECHFTVR